MFYRKEQKDMEPAEWDYASNSAISSIVFFSKTDNVLNHQCDQ